MNCFGAAFEKHFPVFVRRLVPSSLLCTALCGVLRSANLNLQKLFEKGRRLNWNVLEKSQDLLKVTNNFFGNFIKWKEEKGGGGSTEKKFKRYIYIYINKNCADTAESFWKFRKALPKRIFRAGGGGMNYDYPKMQLTLEVTLREEIKKREWEC